MRFLVTNDDGITSVFLHELVRALRSGGHELFVAAPKREQSWIGAAKSRNRPVHAEVATPARRGFSEGGPTLAIIPGSGERAASATCAAALAPDLGCPAWIIDGTPSDAVNIALGHFIPKGTSIDAVISGINIGLNASLGFIIASGTIAGAWEGALHGLPAIAFSQDLTIELYEELKAAGNVPTPEIAQILKNSADHAARMAPELAAVTAPNSFTVHNVNFPLPCLSSSEIRRTVPAQVVVPGLFSPAADDGTHRLIFRFGDDLSPTEPLTDRAALAAGYISHSVLDYRKLGR